MKTIENLARKSDVTEIRSLKLNQFGPFFNIFVFLQVVDVLLNECSIIYECKVCFNLFRSISNFISHKRTFCKNKSQKVLHHFNNPDQETADKLVIVQPEPVETVFPGMQRCLSL